MRTATQTPITPPIEMPPPPHPKEVEPPPQPPPPPIRHYKGHYCAACQWWRYGTDVKYTEAFLLHERRRCVEPIRSFDGEMTGRDMARQLEGFIHG